MKALKVMSTALAILDLANLDKQLRPLLIGCQGPEMAENIVIIAQDITQSTDLTTVVRAMQKDENLALAVQLALIELQPPIH